MTGEIEIVDLTQEAPSRVQSAAFYAIKNVCRGEKIVLITAQEPTLMMQSLDLQSRHRLAWTVVETDGTWRVEVSHRDDSDPRDLLDLLMREHQRLDGLLAPALQCLNRNDGAAAAPLLRAFAAAIMRHMSVEDELLAPAFKLSLEVTGDDPLSIMLREHAEIRHQLAVIEDCLPAPETGELGAFCAILSGTLAKHEHREESNLFPLWQRAFKSMPEAVRNELLGRVQSALAA